MRNYYVSKRTEPDGSHDVHHSQCIFMPHATNEVIYLGKFEDCTGALVASKAHYQETQGCFFCSYECSPKNPEHAFSHHETVQVPSEKPNRF